MFFFFFMCRLLKVKEFCIQQELWLCRLTCSLLNWSNYATEVRSQIISAMMLTMIMHNLMCLITFLQHEISKIASTARPLTVDHFTSTTRPLTVHHFTSTTRPITVHHFTSTTRPLTVHHFITSTTRPLTVDNFHNKTPYSRSLHFHNKTPYSRSLPQQDPLHYITSTTEFSKGHRRHHFKMTTHQ